MREAPFLIFCAVAMLVALASCATFPDVRSACSVNSLEAVALDPLHYSGEILCGEVFAVADGRTTRLLASANDVPPSMDLAWLVTRDTRHKLTDLSETPQRYYVEARIDPMTECFQPSGSGESCIPFRRPVFMHLLRAQKR